MAIFGQAFSLEVCLIFTATAGKPGSETTVTEPTCFNLLNPCYDTDYVFITTDDGTFIQDISYTI